MSRTCFIRLHESSVFGILIMAMKVFQQRRSAAYPMLLVAIGLSLFIGFAVRDAQTKKQTPQTPKTQKSKQPTLESGTYTVSFVVDGDTIELENGTRVRYDGIDAPEYDQRLGASATELNKTLVEGKRINLEISEEKEDIYGRTLGFVWLEGMMVNERLVEEGYARVFFFGNMKKPKYYERFVAAQEAARKGHRGIWIGK